MKRQSCTISRLQQQVKKLKIQLSHISKGKIEHSVECVEKGVQCNTLKGLISDLHSEIDILHSELNSATGTCMDNNINEFRCAVHPVLQFADICQKEIMKFESNIGFCAALDSKSSSDSKTLTLLRFVSKLFYKDRSGDPLYASIYMKDKGIKSIPVMNFRGNRFNVLFFNAAGTFYLAFHLLSDVSTSLFEESLLDSQTETILAKLVVVLHCKCELLFKDFLKHGKYYEPSNNIIKKSASCPPTNICLERLMAKVDSKFKSAPNCNINSLENTIMNSGYQTGAWLEKKSSDDKKNIISEARKSHRSNIKIMKERKSNLFKSHVAIIRQREEQQKKKLEKKSNHKQDILEQMREIGIWEHGNKINTELEKCRTKTQKIKSLKQQFNMIKELVTVNCEQKHLFLYSCKGKPYSELKLVENLVQLLDIKKHQSSQNSSENDFYLAKLSKERELLIGYQILHVWHDDEKQMDCNWLGKILTYDSGTFKIEYWNKDILTSSSKECYDMQIGEIVTDYKNGSLQFTDKDA
ncbi:unnamed protein product [Mytilus coruscus]|uniref:Uncharacterized protein n=1 Tax=Mytilus coruscus TaxID=42192 RepID=A0A6J8AW03_MYTCO|nr:unnamed protein product [Mytilus coruscus]